MAETTALDVLQKQVESLTKQLQTLTTDRDSARAALADTTKERDSLRKAATDPDKQAARIAELEAERRDRLHYDKFAELAKASRAKDKAVKDLWKLSGYKADKDEPDEKALGELIESLQERADYAFEPESTEASTTSTGQPALKVVPASGRGGRTRGQDGPHLTREQMADPKFMLDPRNKAYIESTVKARETAAGPFISA